MAGAEAGLADGVAGAVFPAVFAPPGEQIVIAGQVERIGRKLEISLNGLGLRKINVPLQLNLVLRAAGGRQTDLKLADVGGLLLQRGVNLQSGRQRRCWELPFGIVDDQIGHLQIGFDGGTAVGIVLDGGIAVDGNGNQFLARQQRFQERTQAILIEARQVWRSIAPICPRGHTLRPDQNRLRHFRPGSACRRAFEFEFVPASG